MQSSVYGISVDLGRWRGVSGGGGEGDLNFSVHGTPLREALSPTAKLPFPETYGYQWKPSLSCIYMY